MYKEVTIEDFRGIKHLTIEDFRQVNLFAGKNNCGKTTILEGLFLLTGPTNPALPLRINTFREIIKIDENSWRLIFNKLDENATIELSGELEKTKEKRNLRIKPNMKSVSTLSKTRIDEERYDASLNLIPDSKDSYSELSPAIDGLILEYFQINGEDKEQKRVTATIVMKDTGIEVNRPADYKEPLRGVFINAKTIFGAAMGTRFDNIQITKRTDRIIKLLRRIEPSLVNLSVGTDGIIYCDIGLDRLIPVNVMGDGMFRLLSIILAISDTQDGIVLIDEIENGFHYSSQEILWDAIFQSAKEFNVQIFATTHSIECVRAFCSSYSQQVQNSDTIRLYRIERKEDDFKVVRYDHKTLEASLDSDWEVR
jgi:AAA15 family ATPase/GTPase